jgi:hypothetical protein
MSLESTAVIKNKIDNGLGEKAPIYWRLLKLFLTAKISRDEFDTQVRECIDTSSLGMFFLKKQNESY